ncbi:MAG TPA: helix-turn-helix transcriptional regulator, partial [Burkholderiaceae bacterium]|nr:helix-turn-helix transcriptional regulator [Burkholderiaceae bacterium]
MHNTTELIRKLRAAGFSQTEISRRTGIPQPRLSRWESGDVPASADDALLLAQFASSAIPPDPEAPPLERPRPTPQAKRP